MRLSSSAKRAYEEGKECGDMVCSTDISNAFNTLNRGQIAKAALK
jgi:hypothetical protein